MYNGIELQLTSMPPDSIMLGDECLVPDHYEYIKIQEKREEALHVLDGNVSVIVNKENIVHDLVSMYKDPSILQRKVSVVIEGTEASGDGVL